MLGTLRKIFVGAIALTVAVAFLFFAMVNREIVVLELTPFPYLIEMRLFIFIGLLVTFGTLLGWVVASFECRRRYRVQKEAKRRLEALEDEVKTLRARHQLPTHTLSPAHEMTAQPLP